MLATMGFLNGENKLIFNANKVRFVVDQHA